MYARNLQTERVNIRGRQHALSLQASGGLSCAAGSPGSKRLTRLRKSRPCSRSIRPAGHGRCPRCASPAGLLAVRRLESPAVITADDVAVALVESPGHIA